MRPQEPSLGDGVDARHGIDVLERQC